MISTLLILSDTAQQIISTSSSFWDEITKWGGLASIVALIITAIQLYKKGILTYTSTREWRNKYIDDNIPYDFNDYLPLDKPLRKQKKEEDLTKIKLSDNEIIINNFYIQPYITTPPPIDEDEPNLQIIEPIHLNDFFITSDALFLDFIL